MQRSTARGTTMASNEEPFACSIPPERPFVHFALQETQSRLMRVVSRQATSSLSAIHHGTLPCSWSA